ncbi:MAG: hypothetical protein HFG04_02140 [Oscillibacter sp.]|jgi:hypothetical protein|nr:hypothetical protein [Oscillibacter sp.]
MSEKRMDKSKEGEKRHPVRSFLSFAALLAAVLLVVLVAAYRDGTGFDILRRYLHYGRPEQVGGEAVYHYDASSKNRFALLGDHLVVLSDAALRLFNGAGEEVWSARITMTSPALATGGGRAVAYDVGGTALYVLDQTGLLLELTAEEEEPYIAAALNKNGTLAVTSQKKGYKGSVKVYDPSLGPEAAFEFKSSQRFVLDGYVLGDSLAAVTLGQENGVFVSSIGLYDISKDAKEPVASFNISGGLVAAIGEKEGRMVTVSDTVLSFANSNGEITGSYSYKEAYLRAYDLGGTGFTTLLLNRYRSGSVGRLVTVDRDGEELASLDVREEVLSVSASGRYLAVLYADRLAVYNQDLQLYATLRGTGNVREALMRPDGTVLLVSAGSASLFLP